MKRIKLVVAYDGTNYCGWQVQKNGLAVEEVLNKALTKLLGEEIAVIGASRTDSGVHALQNVAVFDTETKIPAEKLCFALNQRLPEDIRVLSSEETDAAFHPRKCNSRKTYEYKIFNRRIESPIGRQYAAFVYVPLDVEKMRQGLNYLIGEHDFKSFCSSRTKIEDTVRTIYELSLEKEGDMITLRISGSGFLYNMVRIIVGTLIKVGMGIYPPEHVEEILDLRDRAAAGQKAAARGLTLISIEYEKELEPEICVSNKDWEYRLVQREIVTRQKAYVIIKRCADWAYDSLVERLTKQSLRNGAKEVFFSDREMGERLERRPDFGGYIMEKDSGTDVLVLSLKEASPRAAFAEEEQRIALEAVTEETLKTYTRLYNQGFAKIPCAATQSLEDCRKCMEQEGTELYLITVRGEPVGIMEWSFSGDMPCLEGVALTPKARGRGFGRQAVALWAGECRKRGYEAICLMAATFNENAYALYLDMGFRRVKTVNHWYKTEDFYGKTPDTTKREEK